MLLSIFAMAQLSAQVETIKLLGIDSGSGTATTTYLMTDSGRVKNGIFKVAISQTDPMTQGSYWKVAISGNYKKDLPDGAWIYTLSINKYPVLNGAFRTGTVTLKQFYKNGLPEGNWTYSSSNQYYQKMRNFNGTYSWSQPFKISDNDVQNLSATFKNGHLQLSTGKYGYNAKIVCANGVPVEYYENFGGDEYISQTIKDGFATEVGKNLFKGKYMIKYTPEQEEILRLHGDSLVKKYNGINVRGEKNSGYIVNEYELGGNLPDELCGSDFTDNYYQYEIPTKTYIKSNLKPFGYYTFDFGLMEIYKKKELIKLRETQRQDSIRIERVRRDSIQKVQKHEAMLEQLRKDSIKFVNEYIMESEKLISKWISQCEKIIEKEPKLRKAIKKKWQNETEFIAIGINKNCYGFFNKFKKFLLSDFSVPHTEEGFALLLLGNNDFFKAKPEKTTNSYMIHEPFITYKTDRAVSNYGVPTKHSFEPSHYIIPISYLKK